MTDIDDEYLTAHKEELALYLQIARLRAEEHLVKEALSDCVARCRDRNLSWRMIATAMGVSTQAAWQRFSNHERDSEIPKQDMLFED